MWGTNWGCLMDLLALLQCALSTRLASQFVVYALQGIVGLPHQAPGAAPGATGMAQQAGLTSQASDGQSHALRSMGQAGALMDQHRLQQPPQNAFSGIQQAAIGSGLHAQLPQKAQLQAPIGSALPGQQQLPGASAVPGQQQQIGQGQQGLGQLGAGLLSSLTGQSTQPAKSSGEGQYQGLQVHTVCPFMPDSS